MLIRAYCGIPWEKWAITLILFYVIISDVQENNNNNKKNPLMVMLDLPSKGPTKPWGGGPNTSVG